MSMNFRLNIEKTLNSALYILQRLGGRTDFHKLFKILYFADQKHLATYGTSISGDLYVAMAHGPVPSKLYDVFKGVRDSIGFEEQFANLFEIQGAYNINAKQKPNLEVLSESNVECLEESIAENHALTFDQLTRKSHKSAWDAATNDEMNVIEIAKEGGASEEMLKYIELNLENQLLLELLRRN
jgi:uncharacterized phage-associated protein